MIDFSKIPRNQRAVINFDNVQQAVEFFTEFAKQYPSKVYSWTEQDVIRRFKYYDDFCLNPRLNEQYGTLSYCSEEFYRINHYKIIRYIDLTENPIELQTSVGDMSLDDLLGGSICD